MPHPARRDQVCPAKTDLHLRLHYHPSTLIHLLDWLELPSELALFGPFGSRASFFCSSLPVSILVAAQLPLIVVLHFAHHRWRFAPVEKSCSIVFRYALSGYPEENILCPWWLPQQLSLHINKETNPRQAVLSIQGCTVELLRLAIGSPVYGQCKRSFPYQAGA